jgi:hypothetical protein
MPICPVCKIMVKRTRKGKREVSFKSRAICPNKHTHPTILKYRRLNEELQEDKENRELFYSTTNEHLAGILSKKLGIEKRTKKARFGRSRGMASWERKQ